MKRVIEMAFALLLIAGAFVMGQRFERKAFILQIAGDNAEIERDLNKLEFGSAEFVSFLKNLGKEPQRERTAAENDIEVLNETTPPIVAPDNPCKPVPAHCLRRSPPGGPSANRTAGY